MIPAGLFGLSQLKDFQKEKKTCRDIGDLRDASIPKNAAKDFPYAVVTKYRHERDKKRAEGETEIKKWRATSKQTDNEYGFNSQDSGLKNSIRAAETSKREDNDSCIAHYEHEISGLMATVLMMLPLTLKCPPEVSQCGTLLVPRVEPLGTSLTHFRMFLIQQKVPRWSDVIPVANSNHTNVLD